MDSRIKAMMTNSEAINLQVYDAKIAKAKKSRKDHLASIANRIAKDNGLRAGDKNLLNKIPSRQESIAWFEFDVLGGFTIVTNLGRELCLEDKNKEDASGWSVIR